MENRLEAPVALAVGLYYIIACAISWPFFWWRDCQRTARTPKRGGRSKRAAIESDKDGSCDIGGTQDMLGLMSIAPSCWSFRSY